MNDNAVAMQSIIARNRCRSFLRDAALVHTKLMLDGLRDIALFPGTVAARGAAISPRKQR